MAESKVNICVYVLFLTHVWSILVWNWGEGVVQIPGQNLYMKKVGSERQSQSMWTFKHFYELCIYSHYRDWECVPASFQHNRAQMLALVPELIKQQQQQTTSPITLHRLVLSSLFC